jgi:extradiol dioxygenase family protein
MSPPIFHLSFPVTSLDVSVDFYVRVFGASPGRRTDTWCDVVLFGHQLTLHEQPAQVLPREARGVRHFGAILGWDEVETLRERIATRAPSVETRVSLRDAGLPGEHVKLLLDDPDGNLVEIKAYRSLATVAAALGR